MILQNCFVFWRRVQFQIEFTAWVVRSSTYVLFIPLPLSWQPTPFCPLRVALVASRCVAFLVRTDASLLSCHYRRVAFSVRYVLLYDVSCRDWPDALGLIHTASRAEPKRFGLENKPTLWKGSIHTARRTEPSRIEPDRLWPSVFTGWCFPPRRCATSLVTSSILVIPWYYKRLNNAKLCIVTGSECASASNC